MKKLLTATILAILMLPLLIACGESESSALVGRWLNCALLSRQKKAMIKVDYADLKNTNRHQLPLAAGADFSP